MKKRRENKNIFFLTRPFSNTLDAGTKNIPYYISIYSQHNISILSESEFALKTANNIRVIRTNIRSDKRFTENSRSLKNKLIILKLLLINLRSHGFIHAFFAPSDSISLALLIIKFFYVKKLIINIPYLKKNFHLSPFAVLLLKKADRAIVMSEYSAGKIRKYSNKVNVVSPVIDAGKYNAVSPSVKSGLKEKLGLNAEHIIIYPGEYGALNANENSVKIVKRVNEKLKDTLFIFSCRLKTKKDVAKGKYVREKLFGYNVLYLNTIDNYHEYAAASDIAMFPAGSMEGKFDLPLALVELMAMGKPVLHTDIPPLNELYNKKQKFCLPNFPEAMAKRIIEIAENKNLYRKLSEKTLREAERFLPENVIPEYDKIYDELIRT